MFLAAICAFFKYIKTLNFNDKPNYSKCQKMFEDGLKSLRKTNAGDLEFKNVSPIKDKASKAVKSTLADDIDSPVKTKKTEKMKISSLDDTFDDECPPPKKTKKTEKKKMSSLDDTFEDECPTPKKTQSTDSSNKLSQQSKPGCLLVNNTISSKGKKMGKTYQFNIDLNVSIDANVVINVKRKGDKIIGTPTKKKNTSQQSLSQPKNGIHSDNEIDGSPNCTPVAKVKVLKKTKPEKPALSLARKSPRSK